jgi:hypothetical protein
MLSGGVSNTNQNNSSTQTTIKFNLPVHSLVRSLKNLISCFLILLI